MKKFVENFLWVIFFSSVRFAKLIIPKKCYQNFGSNWFVATDPDKCGQVDEKAGGYNNYYANNDAYNTSPNPNSGKIGCILKMSNICDNKVCLDDNYV